MSMVEVVWGEALKQGRLAHAYLLLGHSLDALIESFLLAVLCEKACGECVQCQKVIKQQHPDITVIERDGKRIKIDQIRALQRDARYPPLEAKKKVIILRDVESLGIEAANGLLKILESPPDYLLFLLTAASPKVLPTILSRCQVVRFNPTEVAEQSKLLKERGLKKAEIEGALNITRGLPHRFGRIVEAMELNNITDQMNACRDEIAGVTLTELIDTLAEAESIIEEREVVLRLLQSIVHMKPEVLLDLAQSMSKLDQEKQELVIEEALRWYRDLLIIKARISDEHIFNRDQTESLREHAFAMTAREIQQAIEKLERGREIAQGNANMQLFYESLLFTLAGLG